MNQQLFNELEQFKQQLETLTSIQKAHREVAERYNVTEKKLEAQVAQGLEPLQKRFTNDLKQLTEDYKTQLASQTDEYKRQLTLQIANPLATLTPIIERVSSILTLVEQTGTETNGKLNEAVIQHTEQVRETQHVLQGLAHKLHDESLLNTAEVKAALGSVDQFLNSISFEREVLQKIVEEVVGHTTDIVTENLKQLNATSNLFRERFQKLVDQLFVRIERLITDPNELSKQIISHLKSDLATFQDQAYKRVDTSQKSIERVVVQLAERNVQQQETIQLLIEEQQQFLAQLKQITDSSTAGL